jgi:hypothetical protein
MSLRKTAALQGYSPQHDYTRIVPDGFLVKGVSTFYNEAGKPVNQWVKSTVDTERRDELLRQAVLAMCDDVKPIAPIKQAISKVYSELLNVIPIGDPHYGMYSWGAESGDDFDTDIARKLTIAAIDRLVSSAPPAETCILLPLGDIFHANDQSNQTPQHRHQLDVDTRFVKVLGVCIDAYIHSIQRLLQVHKRLIVRFVSGNHDPQAVWALAFAISHKFSENERVSVDLSPSLFWYFRHGKVLIGATHGDKAKQEQLLGVMATDRASDWGVTKHRYFYTGHVHTQRVMELPGLVCESFRTLAAKDAYAAGYGYRAGRDMVCITHHVEHGEVERHRCDIGMIE